MSYSPIYENNNGHITVCKDCVCNMYEHYKYALGDNERMAVRRICSKFDIYWSEEIFHMVDKGHDKRMRAWSYISKTRLFTYQGKTFDDTLDEESLMSGSLSATESILEEVVEEEKVPQSVIDFWGSGLTQSYYVELEKRLTYWCGGRDVTTMDSGEVAIIKQICNLEVTINRDTALGKPIDKYVNSLNNLLGSGNFKPIQKKEDASDTQLEGVSFGEWIRKWENSRPIPDPDPELQDVDGIIKYIDIWFRGHLCKMLNIKNSRTKLYDDTIEQMRIERPEYEEDDDETMFENIFGGGDDP